MESLKKDTGKSPVKNLKDLVDMKMKEERIKNRDKGVNILRQEPPEDSFKKMHVENQRTESSIVSDTVDFSKAFSLNNDLDVSVAESIVEINDQFNFNRDRQDKTKKKELKLVCKMSTRHDEMDLNKITKYVDLMSLSEVSDKATHIVTGIEWGASCTCTATLKNQIDSIQKGIGKGLSVGIGNRNVMQAFKESFSGHYSKESKKLMDNFNFVIEGDISPSYASLPLSHEDAVKSMENFPSSVKDINDGLGVHQTYILTPIKELKSKLEEPLKIHGALQLLQQTENEMVSRKIDKFSKYSSVVADCSLPLCSKYMDVSEIEKLENALHIVKAEILTSNTNLKKLLKMMSTPDEIEDIDIFIEGLLSKLDRSIDKIEREIVPIEKGNRLCDIIKSNEDQGIRVLCNEDIRFYEEIKGGKDTFVLITSSMESNELTTLRLLCEVHSKRYQYVIHNTQILPRSSLVPEDEAIHLFSGRNKTKNISHLIESEQRYCKVKVNGEAFHFGEKRRVFAKLMLPNRLCCREDYAPQWICERCDASIEYDLRSKRIHCECGDTKLGDVKMVNDWLFSYEMNTKAMQKLLGQLREYQQLNVLLLGETGVGKSTWINGLFNYLTFDSLSDAINNEYFAPIPAEFTFDDVEVSVGIPSSNENTTNDGSSSTQSSLQYEINYENYKICFIDTPGIGDTRGQERDKENMGNILSFLTKYDSINAICILMKPNEDRLTIWIKYCIQELLKNLHHDVKPIILFCFTNSRTTFYRPGNTLKNLRSYLNEKNFGLLAEASKNCFFFDNEAFLYLAHVKNGGTSGILDSFSIFDESWNMTYKETVRLIQQVATFPSQKLGKMISISSAREIILVLGKPVVRALSDMEENKKLAHEVQENIAKCESKIFDLQKVMAVQVRTFAVENLKFPRTVCTDPGCCYEETYSSVNGEPAERRVIYKQICHDRCTLEGHATRLLDDSRLNSCRAFEVGSKDEQIRQALDLKSIEEIPGYKLHQCSKGCMAFEGDTHTHFDFNRKKVMKILGKKAYDNIMTREFSDMCQRCGHSYKQHMHVTYELKTEYRDFINQEVQDQLLEMKNEKRQKEEIIAITKRTIQELEEEKVKIMESQAEFGAFLNRNAIVPYNDILPELLKLAIKEEENRIGERNYEKIEAIQSDLKLYYQTKKTLEDAMAQGRTVSDITSDRIFALKEELCQLKHSGSALKAAFDRIQIIETKQLDFHRGAKLTDHIRLKARQSFKQRYSPFMDKLQGIKSNLTSKFSRSTHDFSVLGRSDDDLF